MKLSWLAPISNGGAAIDKYAVQRYNPVRRSGRTSPSRRRHRSPTPALTNGIKYSFRIVAQNAAGWSPAQHRRHRDPRTVPIGAAVTGGDAGQLEGHVDLDGPGQQRRGGDRQVRRPALSSTANGTNIAFPTTRSYTAVGLNGTKYSFRILAYNAVGWSPASTVVTAVPGTVPGAPFAVQATPATTMSGSTGPRRRAVGRRSTSTGFNWRRASTAPGRPMSAPGPITSGGFGSPINGNIYYFRVAAHNAAGWGQYSWIVNAVPRTVPTASS